MRTLLLILALGLGGIGCYAHGHASYTAPGPRVVLVPEYPGWLWVEGNYYWDGTRWVWVEGYWVADRAGYVWAPGYYHPHSHIWIAGTWHSRPYSHSYYRYSSRDHRTYHSAPSSTSRGRVRPGARGR